MVRCHIYDICEVVSSQCPRVGLSTFVDDLVIRAEGMREQVIEVCVQATIQCSEGLQDALLDVAPGKSVCVATSVKVAKSFAV